MPLPQEEIAPPSDIDGLLRKGLWCGPYHPSWPPPESEWPLWVMWVMPTFVRVGEMFWVRGISAKVMFQGDSRATVIPDAYQYWDPYAGDFLRPDGGIAPYTLCPTPPPFSRVEPIHETDDWVTVGQAAAKLGMTQKEIRRQLRSGQLRGRRDGSWLVDASGLPRI